MPKEEKQENSEKKVAGEDGVAVKTPGILTGEEIIELGLVSPIGENCLKAMSYDFRFGQDVFHCGQGKPKFLDLEKESSKGVTIESLGMILFSTKEKVKLTKNVVGRFGLRIGIGLEGLILQVGPQVEPGYEGPLFGIIFNTQGTPKTLMVDQRFLTIEFSRTSRDTDDKLFKTIKIANLHQFLDEQGTNVDALARPNAVQNFKEYFENCKREHRLVIEGEDRVRSKKGLMWAIIAGVGAIFAIILAIVAIFVAIYTNQTPKNGQNYKEPTSVVYDSENVLQKGEDETVFKPSENKENENVDSNDTKEDQL